MKNGPRTVASVALGGLALFNISTKVEAPSTSESKMNSGDVFQS